jgi:hypothetical protein
MSDESMVKARRSVIPEPPGLGVERGTKNPTTVKKSPEPVEDYGGGQDPHRVVTPVKKRIKEET